jgi:hypothetical protein
VTLQFTHRPSRTLLRFYLHILLDALLGDKQGLSMGRLIDPKLTMFIDVFVTRSHTFIYVFTFGLSSYAQFTAVFHAFQVMLQLMHSRLVFTHFTKFRDRFTVFRPVTHLCLDGSVPEVVQQSRISVGVARGSSLQPVLRPCEARAAFPCGTHHLHPKRACQNGTVLGPVPSYVFRVKMGPFWWSKRCRFGTHF